MVNLTSLLNSLLLLTLILSLGANYIVYNTTPPIYLGHLIVSAFWLVVFSLHIVAASFRRVTPNLQIGLLMTIIFLVVYASAGYPLFRNTRYLPELTKFVFVLTTLYAVSLAFRNFKINFNVVPVGIVLGVLLSTFTVIRLQDLATISASSRLDADQLGSFNAYSFLLANAMLCLVVFIEKNHSKIVQLATLGFLGYLFIFLLASFSRNGMLVFILGLFVYFIASRKATRAVVAIAVSITCLLAAFIFLIDAILGDLSLVAERYITGEGAATGTGRLEIWRILILNLIDSPWALFFGFGMGSIDIDIEGASNKVNSAHNTFLELWYYLGLFAFATVLYGIARLWRGIRATKNNTQRALVLAIVVQILVSNFFDSFLQSSQIGWIFAVWVAAIMAFVREANRRQPAREKLALESGTGR